MEIKTITLDKANLTPTETAMVLGVCNATVYKMIRTGRLEANRIGSRYFVSAVAIEAQLSVHKPKKNFL